MKGAPPKLCVSFDTLSDTIWPWLKVFCCITTQEMISCHCSRQTAVKYCHFLNIIISLLNDKLINCFHKSKNAFFSKSTNNIGPEIKHELTSEKLIILKELVRLETVNSLFLTVTLQSVFSIGDMTGP